MNMSKSGFAPRRRQGGFIQGAILFALVIIAVVVAAFSLANRDSQNNADTEQARVNATFVLKVGNDVQTAINRAIADGLLPKDVSGKIKFDNTGSDGSNVNLFDTTLKYLTRADLPATALATATTTQPFRGTDGVGTGATAAFEADTALTNVGGTGKEAIFKIPGLKEDVCKRINTTVNSTLVTASPPSTLANAVTAGWREGCYGGDTYFRAVVTDAS